MIGGIKREVANRRAGRLPCRRGAKKEPAIDPTIEAKLLKIHSLAAAGVGLTPAQRAVLVREEPECQDQEFATLLLAVAREHRIDAPRDAARCAHLAAVAMEARKWQRQRRDSEDLRALSWAEVGNLHRINGAHHAVLHAFRLAYSRRERLAAHTIAQVELLEASHRRDLDDPVRASLLLSRAAAVFSRLGDNKNLVQAMLVQTLVATDLEQHHRALELVEGVLRSPSISQWPALRFSAEHNLALSLIKLGQVQRGSDLILRNEQKHGFYTSPKPEILKLWTLGEADLARGREPAGEARLIGALHRCRENHYPHELTQILLVLARLHASKGNRREVERFAEESRSIAQASGQKSHQQEAERILSPP